MEMVKRLSEIQTLLKRIDETKEWIAARRPFAPREIKELDAYFRIGMTYTSNALEGNSLTLSETKILLENGLTAGGKPLRDTYEAIGHAKAYDFMLEIARGDPFIYSENIVIKLHRLFFQGIDPDYAGVYRDIQVFITGTDYIPPKAEDIPALMKEFTYEINKQWGTLHPVRLAAFAHKKLVDVHPFTDGNGRTARLLMNLILINRGYQIVCIPLALRNEYISAIKKSQLSNRLDNEAFEIFIAECEIEAQKDLCRMFHILPPK